MYTEKLMRNSKCRVFIDQGWCAIGAVYCQCIIYETRAAFFPSFVRTLNLCIVIVWLIHTNEAEKLEWCYADKANTGYGGFVVPVNTRSNPLPARVSWCPSTCLCYPRNVTQCGVNSQKDVANEGTDGSCCEGSILAFRVELNASLIREL